MWYWCEIFLINNCSQTYLPPIRCLQQVANLNERRARGAKSLFDFNFWTSRLRDVLYLSIELLGHLVIRWSAEFVWLETDGCARKVIHVPNTWPVRVTITVRLRIDWGSIQEFTCLYAEIYLCAETFFSCIVRIFCFHDAAMVAVPWLDNWFKGGSFGTTGGVLSTANIVQALTQFGLNKPQVENFEG